MRKFRKCVSCGGALKGADQSFTFTCTSCVQKLPKYTEQERVATVDEPGCIARAALDTLARSGVVQPEARLATAPKYSDEELLTAKELLASFTPSYRAALFAAAAAPGVRVDANLDAALNAAVSDLDMLAQGRDTVTGDPLTPMGSRRIATGALSALTRAWAAALVDKGGA